MNKIIAAFRNLAGLQKRYFSFLITMVFLMLQAVGITVDVGGVHGFLDWLSYDFAYSTEKICGNDFLGRDKTFDMKLAKNEREGCQFAVRARYGGVDAVLELSDFVNENGDVLPSAVYKESYISVGEAALAEIYPDALAPYADGTEFKMSFHENHVFYIEVMSDADTPAGTYTAKITVTTEDEKQNLEIPVTATVWDFTLPEAPMMDTAVGIFGGNFFSLNGLSGNDFVGINGGSVAGLSEPARAMYQQYYDYLLGHGVSAYTMPYDILDPRADAYMSDPRVTSFCIPYSGDDATLQRYYNKVNSNPVWAEKSYFYPIDEPRTAENMAAYTRVTDRLARLCPGYNMVTPFYSTEIKDDNGNIVRNFEMQCGRSNILCPETICYDEEKDFYDRIQQRVAQGDRSWWYVCCGPSDDDGYCNMFTFQPGLKHRMLFWQQRQHDVTGLLYWSTAYWEKCGNPWYNGKTWDSWSSAGDGCWLYPGKTIGVNGPVGSLRIKNVANGIEDYTYFAIAQELYGEEWIEKKIKLVTTDLTKYTSSDKLFEKVRRSIGDAIDAKI